MISSTQYDCECTVNETEFFDPVLKQIALEKGQWVDVHPINNITSSEGPIEFAINGSVDEFIDLNNTMLQIRVKIVNAAANANLAAADVVAPVNNWLHSMFSDIMVTLSNTAIEGGNHHYPYKAYLTNLLLHSAKSKETQLQSSGWYKDTASQMNAATAANVGFTARKTSVLESKEVEMCGPLLLDSFLQNKYMLHNVDIGLKLLRSKPEFQTLIHTDAGVNGRATAVKVQITRAILHVRRVKALPSIINGIEEKLNFQNAVIPIQRTEMLTYTIPQGNQSHSKESLFRGQMPKMLFVGLVRNDAYNGTYTQNPYNFQHFNLNNIGLYREGEPIPYRPFEPNFANGCYVREYMSLIQSLDLFNKPEDDDISLAEFANGYTIYAFNLTPDLSIGGYSQTSRDGNIRLEMKFSQALETTVNVIVMGIFDGRIEITKHRNVITDWKS